MKQNNANGAVDRFRDRDRIQQALNEAVQETLWLHKQLGQPVVIWRDGQVVWLPPEEIPVDGPPPAD